uniref:Uncharacterized protein n=1 Tax=Anguilla anguilla TaxID=7936 RepID=A0A0E9S1A8_ANGAN
MVSVLSNVREITAGLDLHSENKYQRNIKEVSRNTRAILITFNFSSCSTDSKE